MDKQSKRERQVLQAREWFQNSEEGQQLRERFALQSKFHSSPEWLAFWEPAKAYVKTSEEEPLKKYIEQRGGRKPRPFVWPALQYVHHCAETGCFSSTSRTAGLWYCRGRQDRHIMSWRLSFSV